MAIQYEKLAATKGINDETLRLVAAREGYLLRASSTMNTLREAIVAAFGPNSFDKVLTPDINDKKWLQNCIKYKGYNFNCKKNSVNIDQLIDTRDIYGYINIYNDKYYYISKTTLRQLGVLTNRNGSSSMNAEDFVRYAEACWDTIDALIEGIKQICE